MVSLTLVNDVEWNRPIHREIPAMLRDQIKAEDWTDFCDKFDSISSFYNSLRLSFIAVSSILFISIITTIVIRNEYSDKLWDRSLPFIIAIVYLCTAWCVLKRLSMDMWLKNIKELCEQMSTKLASLTFRVRSVRETKDYHSVVVTTAKTDYREEDVYRLETLIPCARKRELIDRSMPEYLRDLMSEKDWMDFCDQYDAAVTTPPPPQFLG